MSTNNIPNPMAPSGGPAAPGAVNWGDLMGQAQNMSFDPLPDSKYNVEIVEATNTTTAKGKTMFKVTFTVLDGDFANRKLWTNLTISPESPAALGIFFSQMAALGLTKEYFAAGPAPEAVAADLVGKRATVSTKTREYDGTIRNEVKSITKMAGLPLNTVPAPGATTGGSTMPAPGAPSTGPTMPF